MNQRSKQTVLVIAMGVSGCGKSSVAEALAEEHGFEFVEADDFHPDENKQHMASGKALTDAMREPWITLLQSHLKQSFNSGRSCVMSFSGLRRAHRAKMRDLDCRTLFLHLKGEQSLIAERMNARAEHFMPTSLLASQYAALESPSKNEHLIEIDISKSLDEVIEQARQALNSALTAKV